MTNSRARRRLLAAATAAVLTGGVIAATAPSASAVVLPTPTVLGGPGHALIYASGMEVAPDGSLIVADTGNDRILRMSTSGAILGQYGSDAGSGDDPENARDIAVDSSGYVYVGDAALSRVIKLSPDLKTKVDEWSGPTGDKIGSPIGLTYSNDKIYVADAVKRKIRVFDTTGRQLQAITENNGCSLAAVRDADADKDGNIYVANYTNDNILKFSASGSCVDSFGSPGTGSGQFKNPYGVRVADDPYWGESVYVADSNNNRIQIFKTDGTYRTQLGRTGTSDEPGTFTTLRRVAVAKDGDVWGADLWGWRLVRFDRSSSAFTYAQTIGGNPPPATPGAVFNEPRAVAVSSTGNLNIIDTVNQRIVEMAPDGSIIGTCGERDSRPISLNWPRGVALDPVTGDRWVADTKQSRLQIFPAKCSAQKIRVGTKGSGTGEMNWPYSVAIRAADRLAFVADTQNNRITVWDVASRKQIASYTGAAMKQPRSVTVVEGTNKIVVSDWGNKRVLELNYTTSSGFALSRAIAPGLNGPEGAGVDVNGNMWIADTGNNRVLVIDKAGTRTVVTSAAGQSLKAPAAISVAGGQVFVSDTGRDRVLRYTLKSTPPPGSGPTVEKTLYSGAFASMYPVDIATTNTHYYVVDPGRYRVVGVNRSTKAIDYSVGGSRGSGTDELAAARAVATDSSGNVYVADTPNNRIVKYDKTLKFIKQWGTKGTAAGQFTAIYGVAVGPGLDAGGNTTEIVYTIDADRVQTFTRDGAVINGRFASGFNQPRQIEVNHLNGDVYVVNARDHQVVGFTKSGTKKWAFGSAGTGNGQFTGDPRGVTVSRDGKVIFVTDDGNRRVQAWVLDSLGRPSYKYSIGSPTSSTFTDPRGIEVTPDGKLVVCDEWDYSLKEFNYTTSGATLIRELFGSAAPKTGANSPRGLALDSDGHLFASDWWNQRIVRSNRDGVIDLVWGQRGTRDDPGSLNFQWGVAVQPGTNRVFVANRESHEITVFDHNGKWLTKWGQRGSDTASTDMTFPQGLAFDSDGTLLVSDTGNGRIKRFTIDSNGNGTYKAVYGSQGTGVGQMQMPTGIDTAADGTIWVADTKNNRIQSYKNGVWTAFTKPTGSTRPFAVPWGVTVHPTDGSIWVADTGRGRLVKMSTSGAMSLEVTGTSAGTSDFLGPFQVVFDSSGDLFMSDTWSNRVLRLGF